MPLSDAHDPRTWRTDVAHLDGLNTAAIAADAGGRAAGDQLRFVNAGHPPPVVIPAGGAVETISDPVTAPLGLADRTRPASRIGFDRGDTLLLYTDGLIERRDEDIDIGQERLARHTDLLENGRLTEKLADLVEAVRDHTGEDDVAALAARRVGARG